MLQNLRVFCENQAHDPDLIDLIDVSLFYPKEGGFWKAVQDAKSYVPQIVEKLMQRPAGERAVEMYYLLSYEMYPDKGCDPLAVLEKGRVDLSRTLALLKPLSTELKRRRLPIDLMYIDNEGGFGAFNLQAAGMRRIFRSKRAKRLMPPECAALNPDDFVFGTSNFQQATATWEKYANRLKYDALRKVIYESGLFDIKPRGSSQIVRPSAVNFYGVAPQWPIYDYNGWRLDYTSLDGVSSCPGVYVGPYGARYAPYQHHIIWNHMIGCLNMVRSCMARPNARVHPIIPNPSYCHPWIWEQTVAHMVRAGVSWTGARNCFYYWNANSPETEDPLAAEIMRRHDVNVPAQRNLPEIPMDVDTITTGNWTTTYDQFLDNMADVIGNGPG